MSRNRRKNAHTMQMATVIWWMIVFSFLGGTGLSYVYIKNQTDAFSRQRIDFEKRLGVLVEQNRTLSSQINTLTSVSIIQGKYAAGTIQMIEINQAGLVRLHEKSPAVASR